MKCPLCGTDKSAVIDTRKYETVILRVRRCLSCLITYHTAEEVVLLPKSTEIQPEKPQITK